MFSHSFVVLTSNVYSQPKPVGIFEDHVDVGIRSDMGDVTYNAIHSNTSWQAPGTNMWTSMTSFISYGKRSKVISSLLPDKVYWQGVAGHRKIGIIARDKLTTDSRYADACVHGG